MEILDFEVPTIFGLARLQKFCAESGFEMPLLVIGAEHAADLSRPTQDLFISVYTGGFYNPDRQIGLMFDTVLPSAWPPFKPGGIQEISNSATHFYAVGVEPLGRDADFFKWFWANQEQIGTIGHWGKENPSLGEKLVCFFSPRRYINRLAA